MLIHSPRTCLSPVPGVLFECLVEEKHEVVLRCFVRSERWMDRSAC